MEKLVEMEAVIEIIWIF